MDHDESTIQTAAIAAELAATAIRRAHRASCEAGGPMELLLLELLAEAVKVQKRAEQIAAFVGRDQP